LDGTTEATERPQGGSAEKQFPIVLASYHPHHGEEDCLRGWNGSGTIFFGHCNLGCAFCQNADISQGLRPGPAVPATPPRALVAMMLDLEARGATTSTW